VSSNLIDSFFWIFAGLLSCLITSFFIVATMVVTYEDGRLCGPGGSDMTTVACHTHSSFKDSIGQVLHSILIVEQVSVCTGFPFHYCYDGIHWLDDSGVMLLRIRGML
jgi:hypothetical protein